MGLEWIMVEKKEWIDKDHWSTNSGVNMNEHHVLVLYSILNSAPVLISPLLMLQMARVNENGEIIKGGDFCGSIT